MTLRQTYEPFVFLGLVKSEVCWVAVSFDQVVFPLHPGAELQVTSFNQALILERGEVGGAHTQIQSSSPASPTVPAQTTRWQC